MNGVIRDHARVMMEHLRYQIPGRHSTDGGMGGTSGHKVNQWTRLSIWVVALLLTVSDMILNKRS